MEQGSARKRCRKKEKKRFLLPLGHENHTRTHTQNRFLWEGGWTGGEGWHPGLPRPVGGQGTLTLIGPPSTPWGPDLN